MNDGLLNSPGFGGCSYTDLLPFGRGDCSLNGAGIVCKNGIAADVGGGTNGLMNGNWLKGGGWKPNPGIGGGIGKKGKPGGGNGSCGCDCR
ncbi:hypothetical protein WICMUC_003195 [Wickerhamomyces mucosus]|uniref:Uncharacterized protein n=1 Tax=Wickerhamomyces mucosus TaxID=1378264 RepID=A0A9P8PNJ7_9ASCO|nr:hypothetical protein WICMUC_003195 [Wickerhamomyces mucosus]